MKTFLKIIFWTLFTGLTAFCVCWFGFLIVKSINEYNVMAGASAARSKLADKNKTGPITIGVVCDKENSLDMCQGAKFAAEKINAAGGVNGQKIKLVIKDSKGSAEEVLQVAQEFCEDLNMVAVIGPEYSSLCEIVAPNFEYYGILQISPFATSPDITTKGFSKFFRNIPNDIALVEAAVEAAEFLKWKNIAIAYYDDSYSRRLATMFANDANRHFIKIPVMEEFRKNTPGEHIRKVFSNWKDAYKLDAVFVISITDKDTKTALEQLKKTDIGKPVMLDWGHNIDFLRRHISPDMTIYMPVLVDFETREFQAMADEYEKSAKRPISPLAFQSAEAVRILAKAMKIAGSPDPAKVAKVMKKIKYRDKISNEIVFKENGDIERDIIFLELKDGQIKKLPLVIKTSGKMKK